MASNDTVALRYQRRKLFCRLESARWRWLTACGGCNDARVFGIAPLATLSIAADRLVQENNPLWIKDL